MKGFCRIRFPGSPSLLVAALCSLLFFTFDCRVSGQEIGDEADQAIALFNKGQDHHELGEITKAIELYKKALEIISEFPEAELQLGNAYLSLGKKDEAESAFRRALDLRDDWTLAMSALGALLVANGEYVEADALLTEALRLDPQNFPAWAAIVKLRLATNASETQRRHLLDELTHLASGARPPSILLIAKAELERSLGDHRSAMASAERALSQEPNNIGALAELAEIRLAENDPAGAEGYVKRLESLSADSQTTRSLRVRLFIARDEIDKAIRILESDMQRSPEVDSILARLRVETSDDAAALEKQLEGKEDTALLARLCALYRTPDPAKALRFCERAVKAEPGNIAHSAGYGAALVQAKRYDEAITELRKVSKVSPEHATVRANLALALFQARRYAEAKIEFRRLLDLQPDLVVGYYFLAICHDNLGELMDAMANYQEFIRRADPEKNKEEIEKVNLRLPTLDRQLKRRR
ncbi:MAG TPA: tetratricopeptide repeat protein [Pyrinomonadaceae bacterium]|nr:tetratricopeptide repeat protein [Pyrinomonadaceae bacterium]